MATKSTKLIFTNYDPFGKVSSVIIRRCKNLQEAQIFIDLWKDFPGVEVKISDDSESDKS